MAPTTRVAVAGATGNIGVPIVQALVEAKFPLTILTRKGSSNLSKIPSSATVKEVDYDNVDELTAALRGVDVVLSTLAMGPQISQTPLIDAAVAAGVSRFLPSEFGSDTVNPKSAALPVFKAKVDTAKYLEGKASANPKFSYTLLITGPFFDWGLKHGFFLDPAKHSATLYNGGDVPFSVTTLATIGKAVVGVVNHLPDTKNRAVYVQEALTTQNQLVALTRQLDGKDWDLSYKSTADARQESFAELAKGPDGNIGAAMVGFILGAIFEDGYGGSFEGRDDNALLGVTKMGEPEIKALLKTLI